MLKNYFKIAWRNLAKSKLYSTINIVGLTLGIASVLLIILYLQFEFSFDEYHEKKDRIYRVTSYAGFNEKNWRSGTPGNPTIALRKKIPGVADAFFMMSCGGGTVWIENEKYDEIDMNCTESNIFNTFTFPLIAGSKTEVLDAPYTTVISKSTAERLFGNENPVGKEIIVQWRDGEDGKKGFTVTGVMKDIPDNTHFQYDMFLSVVSLKSTTQCMDCGGQAIYALLDANADTAAIANLILNHVREISGKTYVEDIRLQPLGEIHFSSLSAQRKGDWQYVKILTLIALIILVVGCANYMNLATARYSQRSREVGVRKALGADRWQLSRQFLLETFLITIFTVPFAIILLKLGIPWFNSYAGSNVSLSFINNMWFYGTLTAVVIITGLIAGAYPALFVSSFEPNKVLKGNSSIGFGSSWLRKGLVAFQFIASIVMISVTLIILQQLNFVQNKNLGFNSDKLVTINIHDAAMRRNGKIIKQEFLRLTAVESATSSTAPATGRFGNIGYIFDSDSIAGKKYTFQNPRVDEDFIETMGISLLAGRNISPQPIDTTQEEWWKNLREALINETGVKTLGFTNPKDILGEVIGKRYRIVGVVEDFHFKNLKNEIEPLFLRPDDLGRTYSITVRLAGGNIRGGLDALSSAWEELGAPNPLDYSFVDDLIQQQYEQSRHTAWVIGVFAFISILIACMGLFGLAAFTAQRRTKEIGIRKVMGATVANIVSLLSKDFLKLVLIGFVIAVPISLYFMNQWLQDFAYRIDIGVGIFLLAGGLALFIALATVSWQSIRAALANPVDSLRSE